MIKNYLKIALRNILRQKTYSFINVTGLAMGMACCILILLWVQDELSYDRFHDNADQLHFTVLNQKYESGYHLFTLSTPDPLAPALKEEIPEVVNTARYTPFLGQYMLEYGEKSYEETVRMTDNSFFEMFTFPFVKGDPENALTVPNSIVMTEEMAEKYFGEEEAMGKIITLDDKHAFTVTGVMKNIPSNSRFKPNFLVPFGFLEEIGIELNRWGSNNYYTLVQLDKTADYKQVSELIRLRIQQSIETTEELFLHPLVKERLYSVRGEGGYIVYVRIFTLIAGIVLIIACINFMNLSTARYAKRAKEVGLRKVVGAGKMQLVKQFIGESVLYSTLALLVALVLVELMMPVFNNISNKELSLLDVRNSMSFFVIMIITFLTGLVAGIYPAFFLSSFNPVKVLNKASVSGKGGAFLRKALVVFQFCISISLIISTIIISSQLGYMQNLNLGLNKDNIVRLTMNPEVRANYSSLKSELLQRADVLNVTSAWQIPSYMSANTSSWDWDGKDPQRKELIGLTFVDFDYDKTFGIEMAAGRFYSTDHPSDSTTAIVVNEKFIEVTGIQDPIGKRVTLGGDDYSIIGITRNFHFKPMHYEIDPFALVFEPSNNNIMFVKINSEDTKKTLGSMERIFKKFNPNYPFKYSFVDEDYERLYRKEMRMSRLFSYFTILAITISCLGLFALSAFTAEQKTKEIGIRKVLGASITAIVTLLSREFLLLVAISSLIAWPVSWFAIKGWMEGFAYRLELTQLLWIFPVSACTALVIALLTINYQSIKAASTDPVKALKYE